MLQTADSLLCLPLPVIWGVMCHWNVKVLNLKTLEQKVHWGCSLSQPPECFLTRPAAEIKFEVNQTNLKRVMLPAASSVSSGSQVTWVLTSVWRQVTSGLTWQLSIPVSLVPGTWRRKVSMINLRPVFERISGKPKNQRHTHLEFLFTRTVKWFVLLLSLHVIRKD